MESYQERKKLVIVEGLISGGKTTLTRELGKALGDSTLILLEPDEKNDANPYLEDYYRDPYRYSFLMQTALLSRRFNMQKSGQWWVMEKRGHAILDRSYYGDTCFARLQLTRGYMTPREFNVYAGLYHAMTASVLLPSVCLRTLVSPETAMQRIMSRMEKETGRKCETAVTIDYLRDLDREIDYMVSVLRRQGVTVLDVPWDEDRDSPEARKTAVDGLAARIVNLEVPDPFLDLHRRTT